MTRAWGTRIRRGSGSTRQATTLRHSASYTVRALHRLPHSAWIIRADGLSPIASHVSLTKQVGRFEGASYARTAQMKRAAKVVIAVAAIGGVIGACSLFTHVGERPASVVVAKPEVQ